MFIELMKIKKSYGQGDSRVSVLKGIDLSIDRGELCVLLGPSGSGKSTLLHIIGGIDNPDSGQIRIGRDVMSGMNEKAMTRYRRNHLGYVFQSYNLIPNLTVRENIEVGAWLGKDNCYFLELWHLWVMVFQQLLVQLLQLVKKSFLLMGTVIFK